MRINHNISALNTYNKMTVNQNAATKNMEKLSSGQRINRAGDDAAGLAISEKMRGQIRGLEQAATNAQDGISLIQTAEGALNETHAILQRMRELSVQSANDTNTQEDRNQLQNEVDQLSNEITRIAKDTTFNNSNLLDGSFDGKFHIGANAGQDLSVNIGKMDSASLGTTGSVTDQLSNEITRIAKDTTFNNSNLLDGSFDGKFHIGANAGQDLSVNIGKMDSASLGTTGSVTTAGLVVTNATGEAIEVEITTNGAADKDLEATFTNNKLTITLGTDNNSAAKDNDSETLATALNNLDLEGLSFTVVDGKEAEKVTNTTDNLKATVGISISTQADASNAITSLDAAINSVSSERAKMGAVQNRLEHTINNLSTSAENLTAAESRIRDVDMAKEMMEMTKNNILQQAAQSMLAQANQTPQNVLQLLR